MSTDTHGRTYLKLANARAGMQVKLDTGFTCTKSGRVTLEQDKKGLFFLCDEGKHYISGQAFDSIHCIGIYP